MTEKKNISRKEAFPSLKREKNRILWLIAIIFLPAFLGYFISHWSLKEVAIFLFFWGGTGISIEFFLRWWAKNTFFNQIVYKNGKLYCKTFSGNKIILPLNNIGRHLKAEERGKSCFWYVTKDNKKYKTHVPIEIDGWLTDLKKKHQEGPDHPFGRDVGANSSIGDIIHMRTLLGKIVMFTFLSVVIVLIWWIVEILGVIDLI